MSTWRWRGSNCGVIINCTEPKLRTARARRKFDDAAPRGWTEMFFLRWLIGLLAVFLTVCLVVYVVGGTALLLHFRDLINRNAGIGGIVAFLVVAFPFFYR